MRIKYSCVVDKGERFQMQGWIWLNSLITFGHIDPANIYVHCVTGTAAEFMRRCLAAGVNVELIEAYGDKTYCNKIAQMSGAGLCDSDAVVLMDCDTILLRNFEGTVDLGYISAKAVDMPNPDMYVIDSLFALAGLKKSDAVPDVKVECDDRFTYGANFNGGVYIIPAEHYGAIGDGWKKWSRWLLDCGKPIYDAGMQAHIDQVSFCMAVHENDIPVKHIGRRYNYPTPYDFGGGEQFPYVLHYHKDADRTNFIEVEYPLRGNIKKAVETANGLIGYLFEKNK